MLGIKVTAKLACIIYHIELEDKFGGKRKARFKGII